MLLSRIDEPGRPARRLGKVASSSVASRSRAQSRIWRKRFPRGDRRDKSDACLSGRLRDGLDTEQSVPKLHKRISKWGEREQVEVLRMRDADGDEVGPKRFRLGDVLDLLFAEGATRLDQMTGSVANAS